jgi:serine/threonine protein kinase
VTGTSDRAARRLLAGRYELLDRIGVGGMAEVFRARLPGPSGFEKIVVIKRILPRQAEDPNAVMMFVEEAKLAAAANHDNITQVFELGQTDDDGEYFIVLEHVDGTDLAQLLQTATTNDLRIPVWLTLHVFAEVLEALSFLHELRDARGRSMSVVPSRRHAVERADLDGRQGEAVGLRHRALPGQDVDDPRGAS